MVLLRAKLFAPVLEGPESTAIQRKQNGWLSVKSEFILGKEKLDPKDFVVMGS